MKLRWAVGGGGVGGERCVDVERGVVGRSRGRGRGAGEMRLARARWVSLPESGCCYPKGQTEVYGSAREAAAEIALGMGRVGAKRCGGAAGEIDVSRTHGGANRSSEAGDRRAFAD